MAGTTAILHIYNKFVKAATKFDAATPEEIATRASLQRAINLIDHATGTVADRKEEKTEEYASKNRSQLSGNLWSRRKEKSIPSSVAVTAG